MGLLELGGVQGVVLVHRGRAGTRVRRVDAGRKRGVEDSLARCGELGGRLVPSSATLTRLTRSPSEGSLGSAAA
jgi:hypothetical protein